MILAFSGHIDLREKDEAIISKQVKNKLQELNQSQGLEAVIVGAAQGADKICVTCCEELQIPVKDLNKLVKRTTEDTIPGYYVKQCDYMLKHCEHFMVVWDGLFTEKPGGTSWLVQLLLQEKNSKVLHHLITPRQSNPFPVNYLSSKDLKPFDKNLNSRLPWLPKFYWTSFCIGSENKKRQQKVQQKESLKSTLFQNFIVPIIFALITIVFGTIGYTLNNQEYVINDILDNVYKSIDFITLNGLHFDKSNSFLQIARLTGLLTPITAIAIGFYKATYLIRKERRINKWLKMPESFVVVFGENTKANDLIKDLNYRGYHVLQLKTKQLSDTLIEHSKQHIVKSIYSDIDEKFYNDVLLNANLIYMMNNDEENLQDILRFEGFLKTKDALKAQIYIHITNNEIAKLVHNISNSIKGNIRLFNIQQNTIRRLLSHFPVDQQDKDINAYSLHVVGFNALSKVLIEHLFAQLHFEKNSDITLNVYSENPELTEMEFYKVFNALIRNEDSDLINHYIWGNWKFNFLVYSPEIVSKQEILNQIEVDLSQNKSVSLYACLENSSQSSIWLSAYLPRLNQLKKDTIQHLQVFAFFNSSNIEEELQMERYFNKLAPNIFVTCFGNYLQECSYESINLDTIDALAIKIGDWYNQKYGQKSTTINWTLTSYMDKKSNRNAADHIWVKWRWMLRNITQDSNESELSLDLFNALDGRKLNELAEIEHRRWCANLTLEGYKVLPATYYDRWLKEKANFKSQYFHRDLIPFDNLESKDQEKDEDQIIGISSIVHSTYK